MDVDVLKTDVAGLKTDMGVLKTDVGGLKTDVSVLKSDMAVLKIDMATLTTTVQSGFEKLQHGLRVAVLRGEASTARELADFGSRVDRIEDHSKLRPDQPGPQRQ
jgi:hypothetical protein